MNKRCQKDFLKFTHLIRVLGWILVIPPWFPTDFVVRFHHPEPTKGSNFSISACPKSGQFVAIRLDPDAFGRRREAETASDAVLQDGHVLIFKLHHAVTIIADEMVVLWFFEEIRVVVGLISPQIHLTQEAALDQKGQSPVNGGTRDRAVDMPHAIY